MPIPGDFWEPLRRGRITRILDPQHLWALLAQRSIARYREIEARSSVPFTTKWVISPSDPRLRVRRTMCHVSRRAGPPMGVEYATYTEAALAEHFDLRPSNPLPVGMYQPHGGPCRCACAGACAGHIAQQRGATLVTATVDALHQRADSVEVRTDAGHTYRADKVLLATGFSNAKHLLPRPLEITVHARTIVLMELPAAEVARLRGMPSLIYKTRDPAGSCYILPPIRYPNGKYYLKIGGGDPDDPTCTPCQRCRSGFAVQAVRAPCHLTRKLHAVVPDLRPVALHTNACVTTFTPDWAALCGQAGGRPYWCPRWRKR